MMGIFSSVFCCLFFFSDLWNNGDPAVTEGEGVGEEKNLTISRSLPSPGAPQPQHVHLSCCKPKLRAASLHRVGDLARRLPPCFSH